MKQYTSFFRIRFLAGLQYRAAAFAGVFTQLFWGLMELMMFRAFYLFAPEKLPMDMQAVQLRVDSAGHALHMESLGLGTGPLSGGSNRGGGL